MLSFLLLICDERKNEIITELYDDYHKDMIRYAKKKLRLAKMPNAEDLAQDAVQSTYYKIAKYIDKFEDESRINTKACVLTMVSNEVSKIVAGYVYWKDLDSCETLPDRDDFFRELRIRETYEEVVAAIRDMPEIYSATLMLHYCDEKSPKEIAEMMEVPEKTVYSRIRRGREMLLNKLKGVENDGI